jgi:peptide/nickel transport system substrate-binding protein
MPQVDPQFFMNQFVSWECATKQNKWQGRNICRWQNKDYDETYRLATGELDPVKRAALFIKLNDLVVRDNYVLPEINRLNAIGVKKGMALYKSGWDNDLAFIATFYRET